MRIKILVNTLKMPKEKKRYFFDALEDLATRDRRHWSVSTHIENVFDGREIRKGLYLLFGEICDNEMLQEFLFILSVARIYGQVIPLPTGDYDEEA